MKQLFSVQITKEIIVVAEDKAEAREAVDEEYFDIDDEDAEVIATELMYYPGSWDNKCVPYGYRDPEEPDRTVGEWIKMGAAPKLNVKGNV